jgi:hypothetical protein
MEPDYALVEAKKDDDNFIKKFIGDFGFEVCEAMLTAFFKADGNTEDDAFIDACQAAHTEFEKQATVEAANDESIRAVNNCSKVDAWEVA